VSAVPRTGNSLLNREITGTFPENAPPAATAPRP
jgi:hypothetical protein